MGGEVLVVNLHDIVFELFDFQVKEILHLGSKVYGNQGVGGNQIGFKVGQGLDPQVELPGLGSLIHQEGDKEAKLGDLDGNGLYVHSIDAALDQ